MRFGQGLPIVEHIGIGVHAGLRGEALDDVDVLAAARRDATDLVRLLHLALGAEKEPVGIRVIADGAEWRFLPLVGGRKLGPCSPPARRRPG